MATNTLNQLFSIQNNIKTIEKELENLKELEKDLTEKVLSSGNLENRYYILKSKTRAGNRIVQVHLIRKAYPEVYKKTVIESIKVTDLKKYLGDEIISEVSIKAPDTIRYFVEKKPAPEVITA